ncbi:MAG: hypothetical protein LBU73_00635 [Helicobacteraceae bacterium]|jgi:alkyl hydroperoxide reductase subunit AhpF|nr:hypothetical protein [Helicobacteraceae bacterium]
MNAFSRYQEARLEYLLETLKKEVSLCEKSVSVRFERAKNSDDLKELLSEIATLKEARNFCENIKEDRAKAVELDFDYELNLDSGAFAYH